MDKKRVIRNAAQKLFSQFGLTKITTDDIAREAGVSKATIYKYYNNKVAIFKEVAKAESDQLMKDIVEAVDKESSVAAKFKAHLLTKMSKIGGLINFYEVTQDHSDQYWPFVAEIRKEFMIEEKEMVRRILEWGIEAKEIEVGQVDLVSRMMVISLQAQEYSWAIDGLDVSLEQYCDMMIDIMINGIKRSSPTAWRVGVAENAAEIQPSSIQQEEGPGMCVADHAGAVERSSERRPPKSPHTFHIPVMGTGFTIDTPLRVAKYGMSSVISIGDDILIEQMRKLHCERNDLKYEPIAATETDARARRITAYLNLVNRLVAAQVRQLQAAEFEPGTDITRYFELLPASPLRRAYESMLATADPELRARKQQALRRWAVPGSIDVNIMTKLDRDLYHNGVKLPAESAVAMSALRGFAESTLQSSIVLSAGLNRRLYGYMARFADFLPDRYGRLKKKIILKVSDFRSAMTQGKFLAKKGLWVSEFRIESGLNCGGHAFVTGGHLLGPILEEFKQMKVELRQLLFGAYSEALSALGRSVKESSLDIRITVQGGIGTAAEDAFLREHHEVDGTGWGTPFLLVGEVTNIDDTHLERLCQATERDVHLSDNSPLGIPFWNLRTSTSETTRLERIRAGNPGSTCPKGFLGFNTEFTKTPVCRASGTYQKLKVANIAENGISPEQATILREMVLRKTCICVDLAGGATRKNGIDPEAPTAICCGPGIAHFSDVVTLEKMVDHIYGRCSLLNGRDRPHMFITELALYIEYLQNDIARTAFSVLEHTTKHFLEFRRHLMDGINYYRELAEHFDREQRKKFLDELESLGRKLDRIFPEVAVTISP